MKLSRQTWRWIAVVAFQVAAGALVAAFGSRGPIALHFDLSGTANRWGSRGDVAVIILALAAATAAIGLALPALSRARAGADAPRPAMAGMLIQAIFPLISAFFAATALGIIQTSATAVFAFVSALSLVLGLWLGKVEPNPLVGVRTYWASRSRLAWDKSNRLFGRIAFWSGAVGLLATPVAPQPLGLRTMIATLMVAAAVAVFESWRVWRGDPLARG
jgi:hypothetical protein